MTDRAGIALGVAAAIPVTVCALAAGGMLLAGDGRALALELALPGAVFAAGAVLSSVPLCALVIRRRRRWSETRRAAETEAAVQAAAALATSSEREAHRQFLARLDHELKNPLTAIRATAAAMQSDVVGSTAPDTAQSAAWRTVDDQAQRLSMLVRDLRKLSELETRPLELEMVELETLIREAIDALVQQQPSAQDRVVFSVTRVPWPVPTLRADMDLLSLAVDNVLGNAVKYAPRGTIEVRLREDAGWAVLDVADSGRGIPAAELSSVFGELARASNARDVAGSGIGLTLIATIMHRHGGDASIRSVEGSGTLVTLRLPLR